MCTFYSKTTYANVNYDNVPETFPTSKEQRNNFAFDIKKGEMCLKESKVKQGRTSTWWLQLKKNRVNVFTKCFSLYFYKIFEKNQQ